MARHSSTGYYDLAEVFYSVQEELHAQLAAGGVFEHPTASGDSSERRWLALLSSYLPKRYSAARAFIVNSKGRRSRQIDIAIFDNLDRPVLFPHPDGVHVPAESVRAVFEVKRTFSRQWMLDAHDKAASVRALTNRPILAGLLATTSVWSHETFRANVKAALVSTPLDIGWALEHGSFERNPRVTTSIPESALMFFILRLLARLDVPDVLQYASQLNSIKRPPP